MNVNTLIRKASRTTERTIRSTWWSATHPKADAALPAAVARTIAAVRAENLTYVGDAELASIARAVLANEARDEPGILIEAGCALGGSAITMAAAKASARELRVYDVFAMIPPPGEHDGEDVKRRYEVIREGKSEGIGGDTYYGYEENLYDKVEGSFERLGFPVGGNAVSLIKGMVQDTLEVDEPVGVAHIDVDWYEPVMTCLERIVPRLVPGGAVILDDYFTWSGCRKATDEYFGERVERRAFVFERHLRHLVIRRRL